MSVAMRLIRSNSSSSESEIVEFPEMSTIESAPIIEANDTSVPIGDEGSSKGDCVKRCLLHLPHMIGIGSVKVGLILAHRGFVTGNSKMFVAAFAVCLVFGVIQGLLHIYQACFIHRRTNRLRQEKMNYWLEKIGIISKF